MTQKDRTELLITGVLIAIFVVFLVLFLGRLKTIRRPDVKTSGPSLSFMMSKFKYDASRNKGTPFILDRAAGEIIDIKRDPFAFGSAGGAQGGVLSLSLMGIIWNAAAPTAVINGNVVKAGDDVSGFKVKEILQDRVILESGTAALELKINQ